MDSENKARETLKAPKAGIEIELMVANAAKATPSEARLRSMPTKSDGDFDPLDCSEARNRSTSTKSDGDFDLFD
jgi:hypothetical protein